MKRKIKQVVILTHGDPAVAAGALRQSFRSSRAHGVDAAAPPAEWDKHGDILSASGVVSQVDRRGTTFDDVDLCLVLGGDGTMLRGFHLTRDSDIPVAGVNLGRVGFLTTVLSDGWRKVWRASRRRIHRTCAPRAASHAGTIDLFRATNDVVVGRGDRSDASSLGLRINGVTLFEVLCDGVVVGTPAGSSAYSLAAGGSATGDLRWMRMSSVWLLLTQ